MSIGLVPKQSTRESLELATQAYEDQIQEDEAALMYLEERGITRRARDYFRIGVTRDPADGHESYRNKLAFPYITPTGVVSIRFRVIGTPRPKQSKHLTILDDIARLYNTRALRGTKEIYICEGETDTIAAWQAGLPAIGIPGANAWGPNARVWRRVLANYTVSVLADNDDTGAGLDLAKDIYGSLGGCRIITMPPGHDTSSFIKEEGYDKFKAFIARSS